MTTSVPIFAMERQIPKKIAGDVRRRRERSEPLPLDITHEIFKRLDVKTLAGFVCLSRQHAFILRNRDFLQSYLKKSSNRPQGLMFTFKNKHFGMNFFFTTSYPESRGESSLSSSTSVASYHMTCRATYTTVAPSVHGLICHGPPWKLMVYNPSTRRSTILPSINDCHRIDIYHYLGYDPVNGVYKMLCMSMGMAVYKRRGFAQDFYVLTLGNGNSWRVIKNVPQHFLDFPYSADICIDGVLYYGALTPVDPENLGYAVMSFDLRSEEFHLIEVPQGTLHPKLINYEGKLALLFCGMSASRIYLWVLEDAGKHKWSQSLYVLPTIIEQQSYLPFCATNEGEIVLARANMPPYSCHVLCYHPKRNTLRRVDIQGMSELELTLWDKNSEHTTVSIFSGRVDNLMFL